ncbi:MAG: hypothetical protein D6722_07330 [Bacteroidetes bacterium]|nr:MAG: hypothetical protein D6722_07330 [Bacteroidota bacterium]
MISYLLTSAFLSWIGGLAYVLVRRWLSLRQRRGLLHAVILGSLVLPLAVGPDEHLASPRPLAAYNFGLQLDTEALQQHCRCEQPNYAHRLHYRAHAVVNLMLRHKPLLKGGILAAMAGVLVLLLIQLGYVHRLVRASAQRRVTVDGRSYILLYPDRPLGAGAFWLGRSYIVWSPEMDQLPLAERLAVMRHECSHLRQGNTVEFALLLLLQCWWLLNPVFYLLRRELRRLSEYLADEAGLTALPDRPTYARLLLRLLEGQSMLLVAHLGARDLSLRIRRLLAGPERRGRSRRWALLMGVLGLQLGLTLPLQARVQASLRALQTYADLYQKAPPQSEEAVYCPDCDSICTPEAGGL